jgi:hypothetical protein
MTLNQSRYCKAVVKKYLDSDGTKRDLAYHPTPLPLTFTPSIKDCSVHDNTAKELEIEFNVEYLSCIGSLIYLSMTRCDTVYVINKLAKFSKCPGRKHFKAMFHLLRYLRDHPLHGLHFYSDFTRSPILIMLTKEGHTQAHPLFSFSDSSWDDDVDHGRSTGCYIITYMGGVVDHSSNLPNPVALSSAEAEYNEGCLAIMASNHLHMLLAELEGTSDESMEPTNINFDSHSAIAMGSSFRDTKHTRHILRRYHYVHEGIRSKRFNMQWLQTLVQLADIGTKQNPGPCHQFLVTLIHVVVKELTTKIQEG